MIDLQAFCGTDARYQLHKPTTIGDFTYASNGSVMARVPRIDSIPNNTDAAHINFEAIIPPDNGLAYVRVELPPEPIWPTCERCEGDGKCQECKGCGGTGEQECDMGHMHDCRDCEGYGCQSGGTEDCANCKGSGLVRDYYPVDIGDMRLNWIYLSMLAELPGVEIQPPLAQGAPCRFRFGGGVGAIAQMRR